MHPLRVESYISLLSYPLRVACIIPKYHWKTTLTVTYDIPELSLFKPFKSCILYPGTGMATKLLREAPEMIELQL